MRLKINGTGQDVPDGLNIRALLQYLNIPQDRVAVELNKEISKRSSWESTMLKNGDVLEIVTFVGGG